MSKFKVGDRVAYNINANERVAGEVLDVSKQGTFINVAEDYSFANPTWIRVSSNARNIKRLIKKKKPLLEYWIKVYPKDTVAFAYKSEKEAKGAVHETDKHVVKVVHMREVRK